MGREGRYRLHYFAVPDSAQMAASLSDSWKWKQVLEGRRQALGNFWWCYWLEYRSQSPADKLPRLSPRLMECLSFSNIAQTLLFCLHQECKWVIFSKTMLKPPCSSQSGGARGPWWTSGVAPFVVPTLWGACEGPAAAPHVTNPRCLLNLSVTKMLSAMLDSLWLWKHLLGVPRL